MQSRTGLTIAPATRLDLECHSLAPLRETLNLSGAARERAERRDNYSELFVRYPLTMDLALSLSPSTLPAPFVYAPHSCFLTRPLDPEQINFQVTNQEWKGDAKDAAIRKTLEGIEEKKREKLTNNEEKLFIRDFERTTDGKLTVHWTRGTYSWALASNGLAHLAQVDELGGSGRDMLFPDDASLNIKDTWGRSNLGLNFLLVTGDNKIIFPMQGKSAAYSSGQLVPSVSGSCTPPSDTDVISLRNLIGNEYAEEMRGRPYAEPAVVEEIMQQDKAQIEIWAFTANLQRGGKPDVAGIIRTKIDSVAYAVRSLAVEHDKEFLILESPLDSDGKLRALDQLPGIVRPLLELAQDPNTNGVLAANLILLLKRVEILSGQSIFQLVSTANGLG